MIELIFQKELTLIRQIDLKKRTLCHYWYFLDKNFTYGPYLCDGCYNITQKSTDLKILLLFMLKNVYIEFIFYAWVNMKQKKIMVNSNLINKIGILWMVIIEKYYDENEDENENENENEIIN